MTPPFDSAVDIDDIDVDDDIDDVDGDERTPEQHQQQQQHQQQHHTEHERLLLAHLRARNSTQTRHVDVLYKTLEQYADACRTISAWMCVESAGEQQQHQIRTLEQTLAQTYHELEYARNEAHTHRTHRDHAEQRIHHITNERDTWKKECERMRVEQDALIRQVIAQKHEQATHLNALNEAMERAKRWERQIREVRRQQQQQPPQQPPQPQETILQEEPLIHEEEAINWRKITLTTLPTQRRRTIKGHTAPIAAMRFGHNQTHNDRIATVATDGTMKIFEPDTGVQRGGKKITQHALLATAYKRTHVMAAGNDKTVRIIDAQAIKVTQTLTGHTNKVTGVVFGDDAITALSGSYDRTVRYWDIHKGYTIRTIGCESSCLTVAACQKYVVAGTIDCSVRLFNAKDGQSVHTYEKVHTQPVASVAINFDGTRIVSLSRDHTIAVLETRMHTVLHYLKHPRLRVPSTWAQASLSSNGQYVAAGSVTGEVMIFDIETSECKTVLPPAHSVSIAAIEEVLGRDDDAISSSMLCSPSSQSGSGTTSSSLSESAVVCVDWHPSCGQLISADVAGNVHYWE